MKMPKVSGVRARNLIGSLMRKTLGHRVGEKDDAPPAVDLGSHDRLPKLSVVTPLQRRAISKSRPPPK